MITEQQRKERMQGVGGSDVSIILGLSSYKTPYQLYLEKIGEVSDEDEMSQFAYWGCQLESVIRDEFAKRNNVVVETPDTIIHPEHSFLRGNVDGFISSLNAVLEVKTSAGFMSDQWGESGSDHIPMQYLVQVAHYVAVMNAQCAYIAVLIGGNDYREYKYTRDAKLEEMVIDAATKFWNCVMTRTPPEPINQIDLRLMYPKHDPSKVKQVVPAIADQITTFFDTRYKIKQLEKVEDEHKFQIMQFMTDAECLVDVNGTPIVTWKAGKTGSRRFTPNDKKVGAI